MRDKPSFLRSVAAVHSLHSLTQLKMYMWQSETRNLKCEVLKCKTPRFKSIMIQNHMVGVRSGMKSKRRFSGWRRSRMTTGQADLLRLRMVIQCLHCDIQNRRKIPYRTAWKSTGRNVNIGFHARHYGVSSGFCMPFLKK